MAAYRTSEEAVRQMRRAQEALASGDRAAASRGDGGAVVHFVRSPTSIGSVDFREVGLRLRDNLQASERLQWAMVGVSRAA